MPTRSIQDGYVVGAGVDYIAASAQIRANELALLSIGEKLIKQARRDGNIVRAFSANGYRGTACGGVGVGSGVSGSILRVSGARASSVCRGIINVADNVSRIDLQATIRFNRDIHALARAHAAELRREQSTRVRQLNARLERTFGKGDTLYVGSRASNYFGRVYDKHRESKSDEYAKCWRYEVECKNEAAEVASRLVLGMDNHPAPIASRVHRWYTDRGMVPRFSPELPIEVDLIGHKETDAEGQLRWLAKGVSPVVIRLLSVYDESDVIDLLLGRIAPVHVRRKDREEDEILAPYDEWTRSRREA